MASGTQVLYYENSYNPNFIWVHEVNLNSNLNSNLNKGWLQILDPTHNKGIFPFSLGYPTFDAFKFKGQSFERPMLLDHLM